MKPEPFQIKIPQSKIDDLNRRIDQINWPHDFENDDRQYGVPLDLLRDFAQT